MLAEKSRERALQAMHQLEQRRDEMQHELNQFTVRRNEQLARQLRQKALDGLRTRALLRIEQETGDIPVLPLKHRLDERWSMVDHETETLNERRPIQRMRITIDSRTEMSDENSARIVRKR